MNCVYITPAFANAVFLVSAVVSFMQPVQVKSAVRECHMDHVHLVLNCIAKWAGCKATCQLTHIIPSILNMHDAGYPPKVQQPVRKTLM